MYYKELQKLAPLGIIKEAFFLYEKQTREFLTVGKVSEETKQQIVTFDLFCANNNYEQFVVIPMDYAPPQCKL